MALLTPMTLPEAQSIGRGYDLAVTEVTALAAGSVNSNFTVETAGRGRLFLRVYEEQDAAGAERELRLVTALGAHGVPTPRPLRPLTGGWTARHRDKPVGLYEWSPGEILCRQRTQPVHLHALGAALAKVHLASPSLPKLEAGRFALPGLLARLDRIDRESTRYAAEVQRIRARLGRLDLEAARALPAGIIHGDLYRDNVLWSGDHVSALLDFESASSGPFIYDLMVCIHFWCFGADFELAPARAFVAGYESVRRLEPVERSLYRDQAALGALRFATTRITDFALRTPEGQEPGRDFRRMLARQEAVDAGALDSIFQEVNDVSK